LKEWHFAGCLAIDIRHNLADIREYASLIEEYMHSVKEAGLDSFHKFIINHYPEQNLFSTRRQVFVREQFARVLRKESLHKYYKSYFGDPTRDSDGLETEVEEKMVPKNDLSGSKMIVWLTKYAELEGLIHNIPEENRADRVCDWLGIPRDEASIGGGSSHEGGADCFVYVKYPDEFEAECYQPITTNGNWECAMPLFMSYRQTDGWGRTFNHRDQREAAKEVIHKRREHKNGIFTTGMLGRVHKAAVETDRILSELLARFE